MVRCFPTLCRATETGLSDLLPVHRAFISLFLGIIIVDFGSKIAQIYMIFLI